MPNGDRGPEPASSPPPSAQAANGDAATRAMADRVIETVVSPFHCLYQDALAFHTESHLRLARSEADASRLARAALVLYVASAEALVHQAAIELGRSDLVPFAADPARPVRLADAWRLLPSIVADAPSAAGAWGELETPPWPQFSELLTLRESWAYPGLPADRRAYYRAPENQGVFEPLEPHQIPPGLPLTPDALRFPRTGLPRDPYALRPRHLDTARGILDAAIEALDKRLGGSLTRDLRHRREPVRTVFPPAPPPPGKTSAGGPAQGADAVTHEVES